MAEDLPSITIPASELEAELEFGIAYVRACNPGRDLTGADRKLFARALVDMLFERAREGVAGRAELDPVSPANPVPEKTL